jgi:hypothetical protein
MAGFRELSVGDDVDAALEHDRQSAKQSAADVINRFEKRFEKSQSRHCWTNLKEKQCSSRQKYFRANNRKCRILTSTTIG